MSTRGFSPLSHFAVSDEGAMKETSVIITNPTGLHARPAVKLAQLASGFNANVQLRLDDGDWIKAKSVAKVMKLKATENMVLYLRAEGDDAEQALQALLEFVNRDFDEGPRANGYANHLGVSPVKSEVSLNGHQPRDMNDKKLFAEVASPGIATGKLYHLQQSQKLELKQGTVEQEQALFDKAVENAKRQLEQLSKNSDKLAADIIAFQLELLNDADFLAMAREAISTNNSAQASWEHLLENEVVEYELSQDDYFRGRAADLRDLRDRVLNLLNGASNREDVPEGAIILAEELTPSKFLELDWSKLAGAVTTGGSYTAHVSMLARARGVPLLIGLKAELESLLDDTEAVLVAEEKGLLLLEPNAETLNYYQQKRAEAVREKTLVQSHLEKQAQTATGERISLYINVDDPAMLGNVNPDHCDGIGLTRTEFLFYDRSELPDEETQYQIYKRLLEWAKGKPVTIRTLDAGGDKPIPGYTMSENNPFLGVRGLRLSLAKPDVFKVQLRALARAAVYGNLKVMFPMVTVPSELEQAKKLFLGQVETLKTANIPCAVPLLGMMVEVPAAALRVAEFASDFYSIGSNDLIQYVMAAGRDTSGLAYLQDSLNPAVLELIERVAKHGSDHNLEVSVCGEMSSQPKAIPALLDAGIRSLSVAVSGLANVKMAIARYEKN
jgi:phosphoenolpyruvate-protein phosphotransferase (PTS system enzyme I)